MSEYLNIKSATEGYDKLIKQDIKFHTNVFMWKIIFNIPLNPATVNNQNLSVVGPNRKLLNTRITYDADTHAINIEPLETYSPGETYTLLVTRAVESKGGQRLKKEITVEFSV